MAPITSASDESNHQALLDKLDMVRVAKPFRNPAYHPASRRNKNLKQILSEAQRREQSMLNTQNNSGTATPKGEDAASNEPRDLGRLVAERTLQQPADTNKKGASLQAPAPGPRAYTYTSLAAAPSFTPKRKYCDVTGLPSRYQDPKSGLRYFDKEIFAIVKTMQTAQVQEFLSTRGAHTILK